MTIKASCFCHTNSVINIVIKKCGNANKIEIHILENTCSVNNDVNTIMI